MKKVLVTGGSGFIGCAIVPELAQSGMQVFVVDNLSVGRREFLDLPDSQFFETDIREPSALNEVFSQVNPSYVVHLAANHYIPYCNQHPYEASRTNIEGTINVFSCCKQLDSLDGVMFASTAAVYPILDNAITEEEKSGPLDIYGLTKHAGEHLSEGFHALSGVPTLICRFFNALGRNETNPHLVPEIHRQLVEGKRVIELGNLEPKRDFIHTTDMARAIRMLIEAGLPGLSVFNIGSGKEYSVKEVVNTFSKVIGESIQVEQDPQRMRKVERMHMLADVTKLRQAIEWEPRYSLEAGIADLWAHPLSI
jgi:UDP-glucose 4-epimerase